jgi:branched-chain amino acid aminotransferase
VASADEALLTSTPTCVLPVTRFNGRPIGSGRPGKLFDGLIAAWGELVGVDIIAQAEKSTRQGSSDALVLD